MCTLSIPVDGIMTKEIQYFFIDSRNNIQLLMPNFESKLDQQRRVEYIRETIEYNLEHSDYHKYKKI